LRAATQAGPVRGRISCPRDGRRLKIQGLESFVADAAKGSSGDEWASVARLALQVAEQQECANDGLARIEDMVTALMLQAATAVSTRDHDAGALGDPQVLALCGQLDALQERLKQACEEARRSTLEARCRQTYCSLKCRSLSIALDAARADGLARSELQQELDDAYAKLHHLEQTQLHACGHDRSDGSEREMDERDLEVTQLTLQVKRLQHENDKFREQRESVEKLAGGQAAGLLEVYLTVREALCCRSHVASDALRTSAAARCI
jgi:hypothetical protein